MALVVCVVDDGFIWERSTIMLLLVEPTATFYIWADISGLPPPLNDSLVFLEECVKRQIICVVSLVNC